MTVRRLAIGLTIWFTAINLLVLLRVPLMVWGPSIILGVYSYFLLPVRWALVLTLFIRAVRANPLRWLPRASAVQVGIAIVLQVLLGLLSFAGWWELWNDTSRTGDRVFGFVLHAVIPAMMVLWLSRRHSDIRPGLVVDHA